MKTHRLSFQSFIHNPPGSIILPLSKSSSSPCISLHPRRSPCRPRRQWRPQPKRGTGRRPPRGSRRPSCEKQGNFWEAGKSRGPKRHRETIECVHSRKLNMELKTWKCGRWFSFSEGIHERNWWIFDGAKWWNTELSPIKQCSRRVVKINEKMSSVVDPNILKL